MSRRARILLWLLKLSPIFALAVLGIVWLSLGAWLRTSLVTTGPGGMGSRQARVETLRWMDEERTNKRLKLAGTPASLDAAEQQAWLDWIDALPSSTTEKDVFQPRRVPVEAFPKLQSWAARSRARVWAWVVPGPAMPSVVASATPETPMYDALLRQFAEQHAPADPYLKALAPATLEEMIWSENVYAGKVKPLEPGLLNIGMGGGGGGGDFLLGRWTLKGSDGQLYCAYIQVPGGEDIGEEDGLSKADRWVKRLDPAAQRFDSTLESLARRKGVNAFVFGPLRFTSIPLIVPPGASPQDAQELGLLIWPRMAIQKGTAIAPSVRALDETVASLAGGSEGNLGVYGMNNTATNVSNTSYGPEEIAPQSIAFLVSWEPSGAVPSAFDVVRARWERFVYLQFPVVFGAALGFLALSLISSPAAFIYERRQLARQRALEELALMRRDAHDKVYNRLSALSKRVAAASERMSEENVRSLGAIAEDIRATVGDLQEILGDDVTTSDAGLATQPLATQLQSVGQAQAARLGIAVSVDVAGDVPPVSPRLGWDLQCMAEEAITNAVRHGDAHTVSIEVRAHPDGVTMRVMDDGTGSAVETPDGASVGSTGLRGMRERLVRYAGVLSIETSQAGTTVCVRIPHED